MTAATFTRPSRAGFSRAGGWPLGLVLACAFAGGCGGGKPAGPSAAARALAAAEESVAQAKKADEEGNVDGALMCYRAAREKIEEARKTARAAEAKDCSALSERIEPRITALEVRQNFEKVKREAQEKAAKEKELAALGPKVDLEAVERKKKEDAEAKKKQAEADIKKIAGMDLPKPKAQPKGDDTDTDVDVGGTGERGTGGGKTPGARKDGARADTGPFQPLRADQPLVSVDKVTSRLNYALAYIQLFNKDETNRRIARVFVSFKDAKNNVLIGEGDVRTFAYDQFNLNAKDLLEQPDGRCELTGDSHEVPGGNSNLKLIAVAKHGSAPQCRQAAVKVLFSDDKEATATGPVDAPPGDILAPLP